MSALNEPWVRATAYGVTVLAVISLHPEYACMLLVPLSLTYFASFADYEDA